MAKSEPEIKEKDSNFAFKLSKKTFTKEAEELFAQTILVKLSKFKNPHLVAGIDGVGTKLVLAHKFGRWREVGYDAVAMGVNDILRCGAQPVAYLPYIARDKFDRIVLKKIMQGIIEACQDAHCAIIGGETASMLGFYKMRGQHEIAGCAIGVVEREKVITGEEIRDGDLILGLPSSGLHANGFSTILRIFPPNQIEKYKYLFLTSTKIYFEPIKTLLDENVEIHGIVHVTGGGMPKKFRAILPQGLSAIIKRDSFPKPKIFELILQKNQLSQDEMDNTFNMGLGMVIILSQKEAQKAKKILKNENEKSYEIGYIAKDFGKRVVIQ